MFCGGGGIGFRTLGPDQRLRLAGGQDQVAGVFRRRRRQGRQLRASGPSRRLDAADPQRQGPARQGWTQRYEVAALQVAEHLRLTPLHAQQVGGARHVDVEEGAAHQEVGGFRRHVLGELRQTLGRDDAGKAALAAPAHQVGHGAQRHLARLVRDLAGGGRGEHLRLVHHHQHRVPEVAVGIEQPAQEGGGVAHLKLHVQPFQVDDDGDPVFPDTRGDPLERPFGMGGSVHHHMAELFGQRHEIALGIEDRLLDPGSALFDQAAQQV